MNKLLEFLFLPLDIFIRVTALHLFGKRRNRVQHPTIILINNLLHLAACVTFVCLVIILIAVIKLQPLGDLYGYW